MAEALLSVREVARYLSVSQRTVYRLIKSGDLAALRVGTLWRVKASTLPGWRESTDA